MNGAQSLNFLSKPMQLKLDINDVRKVGYTDIYIDILTSTGCDV